MEEDNLDAGRERRFPSGDVVGKEMAFHEEMINTVWNISVIGEDEEGDLIVKTGCGVCISNKGFILTSEHVIDINVKGGERLVGSPYNDLAKLYSLKRVCDFKDADLAMVPVEPLGGVQFDYALPASNEVLPFGKNVYCIFCEPHALDFAMVPGFISYDSPWETGSSEKLLQRLSTPSSAPEGASGSPAFDTNGRIVGIVGGNVGEDALMSPINTICQMFEMNQRRLRSKGLDYLLYPTDL